MTDRPILFSGPMVRAILDGRKTQTRRVLVPRGRFSLFDGSWSDGYVLDAGNEEWRRREMRFAVGDRLWVREAWRTTGTYNGLKPSALSGTSPVLFEADGDSGWGWAGKLRPSMFMPRWASRLTLVVTNVRVERLQDISEADARAEGFPVSAAGAPYNPPPSEADSWQGYATASFFLTWNALNSARGYGVEANPWVVAVTFDVVQANIDMLNARAATA